MRRNQHAPKRACSTTQHDIKLELDVRSQALIEKRLRARFPSVALLGEEGVVGDVGSAYRWVVDPIDGTVNFAYGIPHACVSIALQGRAQGAGPADYPGGYNTLLGVVYDPFCDELWTAIRGQAARRLLPLFSFYWWYRRSLLRVLPQSAKLEYQPSRVSG